jgi:hypothetical protein
MYDDNKIQILTNFPGNYSDADKETDRLSLFDYRTFTNKLQSYSVPRYDVAEGQFQSTDGTAEKVRGRTMKVIAQLFQDNVFNDIFINNKINNTSTGNSTSTMFRNISFS